MAQATAHTCVKKKLDKDSYLVIRAPAGTSFTSATKVKDPVRDKVDTALTFKVHNQDFSTDMKAIVVMIKGKNTRTTPTIDPPVAGTLVITLDNPPTGVDPLVVDMPVQYIDDF